jgi:hypothetical protein
VGHAAARVREPVLNSDPGLEVVVIYTGVKQTLAALRTAGGLARGLNARIRLIVPQVVPYPAPLEEPPVQKSFAERRFRTIAEEAAIDTKIDIWLCRNRETVLSEHLKPRSIVVIAAARQRWWRPSRERRLARILRKQMHQVVLVQSD